MKPILLLDVDGVLNVPRLKPTKRPIRLEWRRGHKISFWPTAVTLRFMKMAWELFDVRWLTAWRTSANIIARHYHLKQRPAIDYSNSKGTAAASVLQNWKGKVAWIEDGLDDISKEVVQAKGWSYFHCEPFTGVTGRHMKDLRAFARD